MAASTSISSPLSSRSRRANDEVIKSAKSDISLLFLTLEKCHVLPLLGG